MRVQVPPSAPPGSSRPIKQAFVRLNSAFRCGLRGGESACGSWRRVFEFRGKRLGGAVGRLEFLCASFDKLRKRSRLILRMRSRVILRMRARVILRMRSRAILRMRSRLILGIRARASNYSAYRQAGAGALAMRRWINAFFRGRLVRRLGVEREDLAAGGGFFREKRERERRERFRRR